MSENDSVQRAGTGQDFADSGDHERRIQRLELAQSQITSSMSALRESHENLRKDLFGDPHRRDEGGKGAFARIEGLLDKQTVALTQRIDSTTEELTGQIAEVKSKLLNEEEAGSAGRATRSKRRWDILIGVIAGLAAGVATVVATILATGHHP